MSSERSLISPSTMPLAPVSTRTMQQVKLITPTITPTTTTTTTTVPPASTQDVYSTSDYQPVYQDTSPQYVDPDFPPSNTTTPTTTYIPVTKAEPKPDNTWMWIVGGIAAAVGIGGIGYYLIKKRNQ
jgi:hypothetical protein